MVGEKERKRREKHENEIEKTRDGIVVKDARERTPAREFCREGRAGMGSEAERGGRVEVR